MTKHQAAEKLVKQLEEFLEPVEQYFFSHDDEAPAETLNRTRDIRDAILDYQLAQ